MLIVGLTGGIASGKSTVSALLAARGIPIIDADVLAREVVAPGTRGLTRIVAEFGKEILLPDGSLNRRKLGEIVFNDPVKRRALNAIVHPAVRWAMAWGVFKCWLRGRRLCVLDVPLLIESGIYHWVGGVVLVYCPREVQLERQMKRDGVTREQADVRLNAQMHISQKRDYADHLVDNTGSLEEIGSKVSELVEKLKRDVGRWWWVSWIFPPWAVLSGLWTLASRRWLRPRKAKA